MVLFIFLIYVKFILIKEVYKDGFGDYMRVLEDGNNYYFLPYRHQYPKKMIGKKLAGYLKENSFARLMKTGEDIIEEIKDGFDGRLLQIIYDYEI